MTRRAETLTAEYLLRHVPEEPLPRFLSSPPVQDGPEYVEPIRFICGCVVVVAIAALIFWGL